MTCGGQPRYRLCPGGGPTALPWVRDSLRAVWVGVPPFTRGSGGDTGDVVAIESAVVMPDGPGDAREPVGQGDGRSIRVGFAGLSERPGLEPGERLSGPLGAPGGEDRGACAMNEEGAGSIGESRTKNFACASKRPPD
jgi:hypothetical protein